jgi:hypothetical protein
MWLFLSVLALASAALVGWRWYLDKQPLAADILERLKAVEELAQKAQNTASRLAMNRAGTV